MLILFRLCHATEVQLSFIIVSKLDGHFIYVILYIFLLILFFFLIFQGLFVVCMYFLYRALDIFAYLFNRLIKKKENSTSKL